MSIHVSQEKNNFFVTKTDFESLIEEKDGAVLAHSYSDNQYMHSFNSNEWDGVSNQRAL